MRRVNGWKGEMKELGNGGRGRQRTFPGIKPKPFRRNHIGIGNLNKGMNESNKNTPPSFLHDRRTDSVCLQVLEVRIPLLPILGQPPTYSTMHRSTITAGSSTDTLRGPFDPPMLLKMGASDS